MALQIRRGTNAERLTITPLQGELIFTTDTQKVFVGDGTTLGGVAISTDTNSEDVQDIVGPMFTGGTHTGISFSYNDGNGTINATVTGGGGGSGTVTDVSVASANGFSGSVANSTTTPSITLSTSVTGMLKGNGTAISAAVAGTDFQTPLSAGVDYQEPLTLTTLGSTGPATLVGNTLNIPEYAVSGGGGGATILNDLTDVTITGTPAANSILKYNSVTSQWVNGSTSLSDDSTPALSGDLNTNTFLIQGTGRISMARDDILDRPSASFTVANNFQNVSSHIALTKTRGTLASRLPLQDLDAIGGIKFYGWDGSFYRNTATIDAIINGTAAPGQLPTRIAFGTEDSSGNFDQRVSILSGGALAANYGIVLNSTGSSANTDYSLRLNRLRGTISSPTTVQTGDVISSINSVGFDGVDYNSLVSSIQTSVEGTIAPGQLPGRMSFSTADSTGALQIRVTIPPSGTLQANYGILSVSGGSTAALDHSLTLSRYKGTLVSPTTVASGDVISQINSLAYDGTNYTIGSQIRSLVEGTVGAGQVPTKMTFATANSSGTMNTALTIDSQQFVFVEKKLWITGDTVNDDQLLLIHANNDGTDCANIALRRSRGAIGTLTAVQTNDFLHDINFQGFDGTNWVTSAAIKARVVGTPATGNVPGQLLLVTRNQVTGAITTKIAVNNSNIFFGVMPRMPAYADQTAAELSVTSVGGTLFDGLMYYDTALAKVRARAGGVWVNLH